MTAAITKPLHLLAPSCLTFALVLALGGCGSNDRDDLEPPPTVSDRQLNLGKLSGVPAEVQSAFLNRFPNGQVTDADVVVASTGERFYKIVFIQPNGDPEIAWFEPAGGLMSAPPGAVAPSVTGPRAPGEALEPARGNR